MGPGRGAVTRLLAESCRSVTAVEIDPDLAEGLSVPRTEVVCADYLTLDASSFVNGTGWRFFSSVPYGVTSKLLVKLLSELHLFKDACLLLQREVAERLAAHPSTKRYGELSVNVRVRADVEPLLKLPPTAFNPVPKVSSSLVRLTPKEVSLPGCFGQVVKLAFSKRRKTLSNALKPLLGKGVKPGGIDLSRRGETLTPEEFLSLARAIAGG